MRRSIAALSLSGALLAGGATGVLLGNPAISGAQATTSDSTATDATAAGPSTADGPAAWLSDALAPLVADGTLTQTQADAVAAALADARPSGRGPGGHGHPGGAAMGAELDAAATALGLSAEDLRTALAAGQTLGQIADSEGVERATLVDALVAAAEQHLAAAVAEGDLTQAEADAKASELSARITERLDSAMPGRGMGGPGGLRGMGGPGGHHRTDSDSTDAGRTDGAATPSSARRSTGASNTTA